MKEYAEIYAVDFDGTINMGKYPEVGEPNRELIEFLKEKRAAGDKVILWTCREGDLLKSAVRYCGWYGLCFDAVNDNVKENIDRWQNNSRKIFADYYIDDRNIFINQEKRESKYEQEIKRLNKMGALTAEQKIKYLFDEVEYYRKKIKYMEAERKEKSCE